MRPGAVDYRIRKKLHGGLKAAFMTGSPQRCDNPMYALVANGFFPFNTQFYNVQLLLHPEHDIAWRPQTPISTRSDEVPF